MPLVNQRHLLKMQIYKPGSVFTLSE